MDKFESDDFCTTGKSEGALSQFEAQGGYAAYAEDVEKKERKLKRKIKKLKKKAKKQSCLSWDEEQQLRKLKKKLKKFKRQQKNQRYNRVIENHNNHSVVLDLERKNALLAMMVLALAPNQEKIRDRLVEDSLVNGVLSYQPLPIMDAEFLERNCEEIKS